MRKRERETETEITSKQPAAVAVTKHNMLLYTGTVAAQCIFLANLQQLRLLSELNAFFGLYLNERLILLRMQWLLEWERERAKEAKRKINNYGDKWKNVMAQLNLSAWNKHVFGIFSARAGERERDIIIMPISFREQCCIFFALALCVLRRHNSKLV